MQKLQRFVFVVVAVLFGLFTSSCNYEKSSCPNGALFLNNAAGEIDSDGDGFSDEFELAAGCDACDGSINPSAPEICDDVDNNCDGSIDDEFSLDAETYYVDADGDDYVDRDSGFESCTWPDDENVISAQSLPQLDCDDADPDVYDGAPEVICDSVDQDCSGDDLSPWALHFGSSTSRVEIPSDSPSLHQGAMFTWEAWLFWEGEGAGGQLFGMWTEDGRKDWGCEVENMGSVQCSFLATDGTTVVTDEPNIQLSVGEWNHVACAQDGDSLTIFVNGWSAGDRYTSRLPANEGNLFTVGAAVFETGGYAPSFNGLIREVRLSNVARYSWYFTPEFTFGVDSSTMLLLPFDEEGCNNAEDLSEYNHEGQVYHASCWWGAPCPSSDANFEP